MSIAAMKSASPAATRDRLKAIIKERSYIYDEHGEFKLASGAVSKFFFDLKVTLLDPEGSNLASDMILELIQPLKADAIGGLVIGACPIASSVCTKSWLAGQPIRGFYVRKEPKKRGTQKLVEGDMLKKGDRVVVVEDVTTSGGSAMDAVKSLRELGCEIVKIITIVDREQGAKEMFAKEGIDFTPLFTKSEFE